MKWLTNIIVTISFYKWLYFVWRPWTRKMVSIPANEALAEMRIIRGKARWHCPEGEYTDRIIKAITFLIELREKEITNETSKDDRG